MHITRIFKEKIKDHYGAISDFTKAIEINPNNVDPYINRGLKKIEDYYGEFPTTQKQ